MIDERRAKYYEKQYKKSLSEMSKIAEKKLRDAGIDEFWIKKILDDEDGIAMAYEHDIPKNMDSGTLYVYLTTD